MIPIWPVLRSLAAGANLQSKQIRFVPYPSSSVDSANEQSSIACTRLPHLKHLCAPEMFKII